MRSIVLASLLAAATTVVPSLTRPTPTFETEVGIQPTFQAHYPYQWGDPGTFTCSMTVSEWKDHRFRLINTISDLTVTGATDGIVHLWDVASGAPIGTPLTGLKPFADTVDMSPDGSTVVGADSPT